MEKRTAIVLGAAGFIGRHVCKEFASHGFQVHGIGHGDWCRDEWSAWGLAQWQAADISLQRLTEIAAATKDDIVLVHCAGTGAVAASYAAPLEDFQRSAHSTAMALEFARLQRSRVSRVVVASSAAVYGDQGDVDLGETAPRVPISPYGFSKVVAENLCESYSRFFGVPASIVRLFSVYGEGLKKQLLWDAANKFVRHENQFFGTGEELRDWLHVSDAARLIYLAATVPQPPFEIYNGGHIKATTHKVLDELVQRLVPSLSPQFNGQAHTGNPRRLTACCSHAHRLLGWQPLIALQEGLDLYARWFVQNSKT